jgi:hypothetical protein
VQRLEFRLEPRQRVIYLVLAGVWVLIALARAASGLGGGAFLALLLAGIFAFEYYWLARFGVTLTQHDVTLHGWTTRTYGWHEIRAIQPAKFMLQRRAAVEFVTGGRRRTWAPQDLRHATVARAGRRPGAAAAVRSAAVRATAVRAAGLRPARI